MSSAHSLLCGLREIGELSEPQFPSVKVRRGEEEVTVCKPSTALQMLFIMTKPFESNYKATIKDYRTMQGKLHTYVLGRPPRKSTEGRVLQWLPFGWYHYAKFPAQSQPGGQGRASAHGTSRTCGLRTNRLGSGLRYSGCKMWALSTLQLQWDSFQAKEI